MSNESVSGEPVGDGSVGDGSVGDRIGRRRLVGGLPVGVGVLVLVSFASLAVGAKAIPLATVWHELLHPPHKIVTPELVADVFGLRCRVIADPESGAPLVIPSRRQHRQ